MYYPESSLANLFDDPEKLTLDGSLENAPIYNSLAAIAIYNEEIAQLALSDPVEAQQLAEFVQQGKLNADVIEMLEFAEVPIEAEVLQIKSRAEAGEIAADLLTLRHLRLGAHVARLTMGWVPFGSTRYRSNGESVFRGARIKNLNQFASDRLPLEDRIQEASIALMHAAKKYRADGGAAFSTYAMYWLEQAIQRAIQDDGTIRIPIHIQEALLRIKANRPAKITHIDALYSEGSNSQAQQKYLDKLKNVQSLEQLESESIERASDYEGLDDEWLPTFSETIKDESREQSDFEEVDKALSRARVWQILNALPERERRVVELRYGLVEGKEWTLEAIAHELYLTRERVRQLEGQALSRLAALRDYFNEPKEFAKEPKQSEAPEVSAIPKFFHEEPVSQLMRAVEIAQLNAASGQRRLDKILKEGRDDWWQYGHFILGVEKEEALERIYEYIAKMSFMSLIYGGHASYLNRNIGSPVNLVQFNALTIDAQIENKLEDVADDNKTRMKTRIWSAMHDMLLDQMDNGNLSSVFSCQTVFDSWIERLISASLN